VSTNNEKYTMSICGQRQAKDFLKKTFCLKSWGNQLRIMTGFPTEKCNLKGHLLKLGWINSHQWDIYQEASETASHILYDCQALATLRPTHLGHHFTKPGDIQDISVSRILHLVQGGRLQNL
jgi:hypothetical protein